MKHTEFNFNGRTYWLSFTAEALFTLYDRFCVTDDIIETTGIFEPTADGWKNCCWLAALMSAQGELQRRHMGHEAQPMLTMEELRTGLMAAESTELRLAVRKALEQGFERTEKTDEAREVNLVLAEREAAQKKTKDLLESVLNTWLQAAESSS